MALVPAALAAVGLRLAHFEPFAWAEAAVILMTWPFLNLAFLWRDAWAEAAIMLTTWQSLRLAQVLPATSPLPHRGQAQA